MHSPLDVMGGRILGEATVAYGLAAMTRDTRRAAYDQAHAVLRAAVGAPDDLALFDAAHAATAAAGDRFADAAASRREHTRRMTFGFGQIGDPTRAAVVPKGAELLLETRFPYLAAEQRRVVLKTTAYPSGYPLMDEPEGWGRLDLFAAADGYAAFDGDVCVTLNAALGGFHARDTWRNDISGAGKLTKRGSGTLRLAGQNVYRGGTEIDDGVLDARSGSALGRGDVYVAGGTLRVATTEEALHVEGKLTVRPAGSVRLVVDRTRSGRLLVTNAVTLDGGTLSVGFGPGYRPAVGDVLNLVSADAVQGAFETVTVDGFTRVTPIYSAAGVQVRIDG
jgi:autotransporter-associated beta strand protein